MPRFLAFYYTATRRTVPSESRVDQCCGATHSDLHGNSLGRAIGGACAALHACVAIHDGRFAVVQTKYLMGTDDGAHAAAHALLFIQKKGHHVFKVNQSAQIQPPRVIIIEETHRKKPVKPPPICKGKDHLISFFTPDKEV
jgi:hypothetical protein